MLNHITLMGRLTRDPELRYTRSETPVASFGLAVDRDNKNAEVTTDFFDIVAWRDMAAFADKYLSKGMLVAISGRLAIGEWTDKEGRKRKKAEIHADNIYFGEPRRASDTPSKPVNVDAVEFEELGDDDGGDLPF